MSVTTLIHLHLKVLLEADLVHWSAPPTACSIASVPATPSSAPLAFTNAAALTIATLPILKIILVVTMAVILPSGCR